MALFYDTCSLLLAQENAFKDNEKFYISLKTLEELENIKTSNYKSEEIKYQARHLLHLLLENEEKYIVKPYSVDLLENLLLPNTNDSLIITSAIIAQKEIEDLIFITNDLACRMIAKAKKLTTRFYEDNRDNDYKGYLEVIVDENQQADFYSNSISINSFNLLPNQYILLKDKKTGTIIDTYKWTGIAMERIPFRKTESSFFGKTTPKDGDVYQKLALDSLITNQITMLKGPAGSGKSWLAFSAMFDMLEHGKISKIVIFCNTVATKGSAKLGFYPGSRIEKLLDSQIGNFLESKLGGKEAVEMMINKGSLILLPMSDIRGYDTTGMNACIYITEAQNLDIELMRLALQRIGEDSYCILDGDDKAQVDLDMYAGARNGMRRVSEVFRGNDFYGEVELQNIKRSKIAELAQEL